MLSKKAECSRPWRGPREHSVTIIFMYKILSFGRSCKAYLRIYKDSGPDITLCCENCGHRLHKHGRYYRYVAGKTEYLRIPIYRWLCPKCGTTVSLLPDFLVPWARCATWIREGAIKRKQLGHSFRRIAETVISPKIGLSSRTVKRWWRQQLARAADASLWLAGELVRLRCDTDLLRMFPNPVSANPANVWKWIEDLLRYYAPRPSRLRGYWAFLNTRMPKGLFL